MRRIASFIWVLLLASGCSKVSMVDDVEFDLDFFVPWSGISNEVHTPYVIGAQPTLIAQSTDSHADMSQWKFVSSDPSVFAIGKATQSRQSLSALCHAATPGQATVRIVDQDGNTLASQDVEVKVPDTVKVLAHGPLILGRSDAEAQVAKPEIVAGGTATFLIKYFANGVELSGNGVLTTFPSTTDLVATPEQTEFLVERDWLRITAPSAPGPQSIGLDAGGTAVAVLDVDVVAPTAIDHLRLEGSSESGVKNGTWLVVVAEALDASSSLIFGVDYAFDVDGATQPGLGDLYRYQLESGSPRMLTARTGSQQAQAMIHSGQGYVDSTNNIGCNLSQHPGGGLFFALALLFTVILLRRNKLQFKI